VAACSHAASTSETGSGFTTVASLKADSRTAPAPGSYIGSGFTPTCAGEASSGGDTGSDFALVRIRETGVATTACVSVDATATLPGEARTSAVGAFVAWSSDSTWRVAACADRADDGGLPTDAAVAAHADLATAPSSHGRAARAADHH
jgi:hypothetical protein